MLKSDEKDTKSKKKQKIKVKKLLQPSPDLKNVKKESQTVFKTLEIFRNDKIEFKDVKVAQMCTYEEKSNLVKELEIKVEALYNKDTQTIKKYVKEQLKKMYKDLEDNLAFNQKFSAKKNIDLENSQKIGEDTNLNNEKPENIILQLLVGVDALQNDKMQIFETLSMIKEEEEISETIVDIQISQKPTEIINEFSEFEIPKIIETFPQISNVKEERIEEYWMGRYLKPLRENNMDESRPTSKSSKSDIFQTTNSEMYPITPERTLDEGSIAQIDMEQSEIDFKTQSISSMDIRVPSAEASPDKEIDCLTPGQFIHSKGQKSSCRSSVGEISYGDLSDGDGDGIDFNDPDQPINQDGSSVGLDDEVNLLS